MTEKGHPPVLLPHFEGRTGIIKADQKGGKGKGTWNFVVRAAWVGYQKTVTKNNPGSFSSMLTHDSQHIEQSSAVILIELDNGQVLETPLHTNTYDINLDPVADTPEKHVAPETP